LSLHFDYVASHNEQRADSVELRHENTRKVASCAVVQSGYSGRVSSARKSMAVKFVASGLTLLFAFVAQTAHAFIDPPWITPEAPRAGETVSVNIRMGICDATAERPGYPQITQEGSAIRIVEYGHHWDDDALCIYGIGTSVDPIGAFPPGDYMLTVDFFYQDFLFGPTIMSLGVIPFTVTGAAPVASVPTSSPLGLLALLLLVSGLAFWALRSRRQRYR
jgi:hypothetical protein